VPVPEDRLAQWRASADILGRLIAADPSLRWRGWKAEDRGELEIGVVAGEKPGKMIKLRIEGELAFVTGTSSLALSTVLFFRGGSFGLEGTRIRQWMDATATEKHPISASRVRYESRKLDTHKTDHRLQRIYRGLKREKPGRRTSGTRGRSPGVARAADSARKPSASG
jgi:hypothetical protein